MTKKEEALLAGIIAIKTQTSADYLGYTSATDALTSINELCDVLIEEHNKEPRYATGQDLFDALSYDGKSFAEIAKEKLPDFVERSDEALKNWKSPKPPK